MTLIHVKTEVVAITMTDLSLVRVMLDGQERSVKWVSLTYKKINMLKFSVLNNAYILWPKNHV